ncbi:MAG: TonB-dependent receptor [Pelagibacteraceae bacterium]|nr:TonB-dependent receptor [Pelagibacteraceae bacterium]|tara:strand:+ start:31419 stop:34388 length:2970 start_codon:yes stop_codon:yes gene_type:complete
MRDILLRIFILTQLFTFTIFAQDDFSDEQNRTITITGYVTDSGSGSPLAGANVVVDGSDAGAATDEEGMFSIEGVDMGSSITASMIGYADMSVYADTDTVYFELASITIEMDPLEVLSSRASEKTPVAYTNVSQEDIKLRLGSRDIPLVLNTVPSVYATGQGGGAGDARINVRGFNQRNVAIMINGIPVNDMENGWVYWSNWDGLADATKNIQMQKGLSAQNLATPSIGGSMNIITDPAGQERRGLFKQEVGAWGFLKTTASLHSGLMMDDKLAMSATLVRKTGEGYVSGTWTDAWAYYFDATYNINDAHRLQFYALGAPQRHGQNLYRQNIAAYDEEFAKGLETYEQEALAANGGEFMEAGREFNQNVANLSDASQAILDAGVGQHYQMYGTYDGVDRHEKGTLAERENFFHKPQVALNHYWTVNDKMKVNNSFYWSGGMGGGTGTYGTITSFDAEGVSDAGTAESNNYKFYYGPSPWTRDWNSLIAINSAPAGMAYAYKREFDRGDKESIGILRNSNNRQSTIGALSKLTYDVNNNLKAQLGIDWRTAQIYHVKTIRDLLGGEYFVNTDSDFDADGQQKGLGDPIDYNFTNTVDWLGFFGQAEYSSGPLTGYAMAGLTTVKYTMWDHFKKAENYDYAYVQSKDGSDADWVERPGDDMGGHEGELYIEADPITTSQLKGGVMYSLGDVFSFLDVIPVVGKVGENADAWFNFGLIDKAPIFDQVIQDWDATMSTDPKNENFTAFEFGINSRSNDGTVAAKLNYFNTTWSDRIATRQVQNLDGDDEIVYLTGISQNHSGIEYELSAQVHEMVRLDAAIGFGNYKFTDDASGTYRDGDADVSYAYSLKDLLVGDMPQTTFNLMATIKPIEGLTIQPLYKFYGRNISDWSVSGREYEASLSPDSESIDRLPAWIAPSYGVIDLHAYYDLPMSFGPVKPQVFLHVYNLLDETYIQDATDNSSYNAWNKNHTADDAEVFFGLPMNFNLGVSVNF